MFAHIRQSPLRASIALGIPALIALIYLIGVASHVRAGNEGQMGALLDDTWIHVRFAESISEGHGLSYNAGTTTSGATSPLWVLTLGAIFAVFDPGIYQQVDVALLLSAAGFLLCVVSVSGFTWFVTENAWLGLFAGTITALTGRMVWMAWSGMEITTFAALCVLALWSHIADVRSGVTFGWRTGILSALATLARPEGYLLALVIGFDAFVLTPLTRRDSGQTPLNGWRGIVAYLLLAGSYPITCLLIDGYPLPNTFRVKSHLGKEMPDLLYGYFWTPRMDHGWLLIALAAVGAGFLLWLAYRRQAQSAGFAVALWPIAFVIAVLFLGPQHYVVNNARYVAPVIPFHAFFAAVGLWALWRYRRLDSKARSALVTVLASIMVVMVAWNGRNTAEGVANDVKQLRTMHVAAGEWLTTVTEPGDLVALNDVGAIVHLSDRPVLDMVGLVSPEVIEPISQAPRFTCPHDLALMRLMLEEPPVLIGVFPWFFPCMTNVGDIGFPDIVQAFNVFTITGPTVIAGGEMVFYWPMWERWPVQAAIPASVTAVDAPFEQGINLSGYQVTVGDGAVQVDLWWTVTYTPSEDFTAFVHVLDADGEIIAQSDTRPRDGRFNTLWWREGDIIPDWRTIPMTAEQIENADAIRIGLYPTSGGDRLQRLTAPPDQPDFIVFDLE